jgi:histidinol-phosphatase (PHP family)
MKEKKPLFSSMHTHTIFCDGQDDVETMCRAAYEKDLYAVGFSAHAPIYKQTGIDSEWNLKEEKVDEYVSEVLAAKKRWQGKLAVFLGYEVDYIRGMRSPLDGDIRAINPDFLIGSVHYIFPANGARPFTVDGPPEEFETGVKDGFGGDAGALMRCYYDAVMQMIEEGGFDILAHADIIKKNCQDKKLWDEQEEFIRQKEIAAFLSRAGLTAEVNTGGINRGIIRDVYPSLQFLRLFREYDVPVTITADAHCARQISGNYNIALQTLISAGFSEHMIFFGKKNGKTIWKKQKILYKGLD